MANKQNIQYVFVLGAGASKDYGLPTGEELKSDIVEFTENEQHRRQLAEALKVDQIAILEMSRDLKCSDLGSIDAWLERRPKFIEIGKTCIAYAIGRREYAKSLSGYWYKILWQKLTEKAHTLNHLPINDFAFITFNYDRSLEEYLMRKAFATFGESPENCAEVIKKIPIVHVYGQAGYLAWQDNPQNYKVRPYKNDISFADSKECAQAIKIMNEHRDDGRQLTLARELLGQAVRIFFLGFGYHKENMERLAFPDQPRHPCVMGTYKKADGFDFPSRIKDKNSNGFGEGIQLCNTPIETFLNEVGWR